MLGSAAMNKLLRVVSFLFLLLGLIGAATAAGFLVMRWVRDRIWSDEVLHLALYGVALAAVGMITLALLEIRDAITHISLDMPSSDKPQPQRRNIDVRTSYLDIRER